MFNTKFYFGAESVVNEKNKARNINLVAVR